MNKKYRYLVVILLIIASLISYGRISGNGFINYDDPVYITENNHIRSGFNPENIKWAFTAVVCSNWHPLTLLSHALDWRLFENNAAGHHLVSLLLHIGAVLLLFFFLNKTTKNIWPSAFAAALFALHPLRVESVAWVAERKDVLSLFFGLASIYVYACYTESSKLSRYFLCLILFALSLMAKPMLVTLPFVLLLLDYWPLERWQVKTSAVVKSSRYLTSRLMWEKVPFILLTIVSSVVTIWAQNKGGAFPEYLPFPVRVINAIISYMSYLEKIFWPVDLAVFYPYEYSFPFWKIMVSLFFLTGMTVVVISAVKKMPFLFVGWFWYLGTLIPVIGLVQVGSQSMADRYTYFPSIGIAIIFAWGIPYFIKNEQIRKNILFPAGIAVLILLTFLTWKQCGYWKNNLALFGHALQVTKNNALAHNQLGLAFIIDEGNVPEAIDHFNTSISINPRFILPYYNRGNVHLNLGLYERAMEDYNYAISLKPDYAEGYYSRGSAFIKLGQYRQAIDDFNRTIVLKPDYVKAYNNRGIIYGKLGQYYPAIENFNEIIRRQPDYASAYCNRGFAFYKLSQYKNAIDDYSKAIVLNPNYIKAYYNRGNAYLKLGLYQSATNDFNKAVSLKSDDEGDHQLLNQAPEVEQK